MDSETSDGSDDSFLSDSEYIDNDSEENDDSKENDENAYNFDDSASSIHNNFKNNLRKWAIVFHISLIALTSLLFLLQSVVNFPLPLDARTLLGTIRNVKVSQMGSDGTFHHFGSERTVRGILQDNKSKGKTIEKIKLVFNIDGLPIYNSGTDRIWLILCAEINGDLVYPVGAFYEKKKSDDTNEFLNQFVSELNAKLKAIIFLEKWGKNKERNCVLYRY